MLRQAVCIHCLLAAGQALISAQQSLIDQASAILHETPLIDGHNDIPRLRRGGVGGQFWSVYVPATMQGKQAVRATMEQIDVVYQLVDRYPDTFEIARTAADVERIFKAGKIASLIGMEGGHSIDN